MAQDGSVSSSRDEVSNYGPKNMFVNDGSFLERFRKQMEAMEKKSSAKDDGNAKQGTTKDKGTESSDKQGEQNTNQNPEKTSASRLLQGKRKVLTGKMGGAGKQLNAKKKKEEKAAAAKKNEEEGKPSAWNAYMEEVKRYREMTCAEDVDRVRPLVK